MVISLGLIEFLRSASEKSPLKGSTYMVNSKRVIYSSGVDFAPCNGILEKNHSKIEPKEIEETIDFFKSRGLPFVWWTDSSALKIPDFQFGGHMTGISLNLKNEIKTVLPSPKLTIKTVSTKKELTDFCKVIADCFGFNAKVEEQYLQMCQAAMDQKEQIHFLAYVDDIPVSTATLSTTPLSAGIWNCATLPSYRKKGIGTALAYHATQHAKEKGHSEVMAVLMPKGMACGLFKSLGYQEVSTLPFYVYGASASDIEK